MAVELEVAGADGRVGTGLADRLAGVLALQPGQVLGVCGDGVGEAGEGDGARSGTKPTSSMAFSTFRRIFSLTSGCPEMTRETEDTATPAYSATSRIATRCGRLPRIPKLGSFGMSRPQLEAVPGDVVLVQLPTEAGVVGELELAVHQPPLRGYQMPPERIPVGMKTLGVGAV